MKTVTTIAQVREIAGNWKKEGKTIGFVPTMGFLHEGHGSLISKAGENDKVVVSIFVNPMQFGPTEDLGNYPRDFEKDSALCESLGADLIFHPEENEMYEEGFCSYADMSGLTEELCGLSRPVHFRGVCTVLMKLFHIVQPDRAYFGQKDAQQSAIVKRLVSDFNIPTEIISCPIVREADGLAKSSRNSYLNQEERREALVLSQAVALGSKLVSSGESSAEAVVKAMADKISESPLAKIDYVKAVDGLTMKQITVMKAPALVAVAVYFGTTRLIDNFIVE